MGKKLIIKGADFYLNALIKGEPSPVIRPILKTGITSTSIKDCLMLISSSDGYDALSDEECQKIKVELTYEITSNAVAWGTQGVYLTILRDKDGNTGGIFNYQYGSLRGFIGSARYSNTFNISSYSHVFSLGTCKVTIQYKSATIECGDGHISTLIMAERSPLPTAPITTLSLFPNAAQPTAKTFSDLGYVKGVKIYYDDELIKDFVPASYQDVPCLYDQENDIIVYNSRADGESGLVLID